MIGQMVNCVIRSANDNHMVTGKIVRQCDNPNVYVLELSHTVDFVDDKRYTYSAGSTMLVSSSEIVR
jgi:hypothetical protein